MEYYKILDDEGNFKFKSNADKPTIEVILNLLKEQTTYDYSLLAGILNMLGYAFIDLENNQIAYIEI